MAAHTDANIYQIAVRSHRHQIKIGFDTMANKLRYKSDAFEAIHSAVEGMYRAGTINQATMRRFDESCLAVPAPIEPRQIKKLRQSQKVSQPVFARFLNTSTSTVARWEAGTQKPNGFALRLLSIVQKHGLQVLS